MNFSKLTKVDNLKSANRDLGQGPQLRIPPSPPIFKLETGGITNPTIETLQKISKALDVSVDDLIK